MEDYQIIIMLFERSEAALDHLAKKYAGVYKRILWEILRDESDMEECANDVLLAVWNSIPPNDPQNLPAYLCRIARRIGIDKLRHRTRKKRDSGYTVSLSELNDCLTDTGGLPGENDDGQIRRVLSEFVRQLDPETRVLFIRRYVYLESVASLSKRFSLNENYIAVKLYRARKKLKKHLIKEDISL